jgi:hypothetical protein
MMTSSSRQTFGTQSELWPLHREKSLNWLALGLLLAAWNAADDASAQPRPPDLRGYACVSVRAATRSASGRAALGS